MSISASVPVRSIVAVPAATLLCACVAVAPPVAPPCAGPVPADAFVANAGQWPGPVRFARRVVGGLVWVEDRGVTVQIPVAGGGNQVVRLGLGAVGARPEGEGPAATRHAYFLGDDPGAWIGAVPSFASVIHRGVARGVDVRLRVAAGKLEYDVELAPGAELREFKVEVEGAERLSLASDGSLLLHTAAGILRQAPSPTWQHGRDGERIPVPCRYELRGPSHFGFAIEAVDPTLPTTIDPGLDWSTFLGGSSYEFTYASAPAPGGGSVVVGETASTNFPVSAGAYDPTYNGFGAPSPDVFVTRFDAAGGLVFSTYLGGSGGDKPYGVAVTASGETVVAGNAASSNFPTTAGAWSRTLSGRSDGFVSRLNASGTQLLASTLLGGNDGDVIQGLALDAAGRAVVAGVTSSANYPTTAGAWTSVGGGTSDAFATCVSVDASTLVWSSVFGGGSGDVAQAVAMASDGRCVVVGVMSSNDFPTTAGAFQRTASGPSDGFVLCLAPGATAPVFATLLGGSSGDVIEGVCLDGAGRAIVTGVTSSNDFPTTAGAFSRTVRGSSDSFVSWLALDGTRLVASTVLGGGSGDVAKDLALDASGAVVVGGQTSSSDFPVTPGAYQTVARGSADGYLARVSPDASSLLEATYLGGGGSDGGEGMSIDAPRSATLVGVTGSGDYPTTPGALRTSLSGTNDGFVARLPLTGCGDVPYGTSTPSCRGASRLGLARCAVASDAAFALVGTNAPELSAGVLILGAAPLGGLPVLGITLFVSPAPPALTVPLASDADGRARLPLPLLGVAPGTRAFVQMAFVNPAGCGGLLSASNALEFVVQ